MLKVLFAGSPEVAVPSLRMLAEDTEHFEVVAVLTRPDAPTGRGRKLVPNPVKQAALELGLPVIESDPSEETFINELTATGAQAAAVVAYGKILKQEVLDALPMGWYNLHFSLLPQWRGAAPVQRSIWAGDTLTGATVFRIVRKMDAGPILAQSTVEIGAHETSGELLNRLAPDCWPLRCKPWPMIRSRRSNSPQALMKSPRRSPLRMRAFASTFLRSPSTGRFVPALRILAPGANCMPALTPSRPPCMCCVRRRLTWTIRMRPPRSNRDESWQARSMCGSAPPPSRWSCSKSRLRAKRPCVPLTGPVEPASTGRLSVGNSRLWRPQ